MAQRRPCADPPDCGCRGRGPRGRRAAAGRTAQLLGRPGTGPVGRPFDGRGADRLRQARTRLRLDGLPAPQAAAGDSVTKPSACMIAKPIRGQVAASWRKTRKRGTHSGWNLALNLYSDSIWNQRDRKTSSPRQPRSTGPAPIRSPRASAERNIAKFSDTRVIPARAPACSAATISSSLSPGSARGRAASAPATCRRAPQGTKCSTARRSPSSGPGARPRAPCGR